MPQRRKSPHRESTKSSPTNSSQKFTPSRRISRRR